MVSIAEETPEDHPAILAVNRLAFGGDVEARLVDRLRAEGLVVASLVAMEEERVVGHIVFSHLPIETNKGTLPAAALAPMAVLPAWQRRGVGAALIRKGLDACKERGKLAIMVVGHPDYYPRFGFSAGLARNLVSPYSGDALMALELKPGALYGVAGAVRYPEAFDAVS